ncbi:MAG: N-acetyl sugar amidotransferase [Alphaproteobacteria bacterium]|nr:N-acetyl sugar amidotransferase [Alphaproteobacteria bacterium]
MSKPYQICTRCVMDTSDPWIAFDANGVCSHCNNFENNIKSKWFPNEEGKRRLAGIADKIRAYGKGREYDCIIGISGGVDSSYLLYVAKEIMGLRPLAVHVDAGWNSELAVRNIENLTKGLGIELFTHVIDWEEMRDLQLAYLKAALANQDVPQDHAFFAKLYEFAITNNIKYVLTGSNFATESILPSAWGYNAYDARQIRAIHRLYGKRPLKTFPLSGLFKVYIYYPYIRRMKVVKPLNFLSYNKDEAIRFLSEKFNWVYYGGKHFESRWTRFFQSYYLPVKFGYDKRRAHLASQIVSGQRTREESLRELEAPSYDAAALKDDMEYIAKKLEISAAEFERILKLPNKEYTDYPNSQWFDRSLRYARSTAKKLLSFIR